MELVVNALDHDPIYVISFIFGIVIVSTLGEYYLGSYSIIPVTNPDKRTIMQMMDYLPSNFEITTGKCNIRCKLEEMTKIKKGIKIKSVRCITKSGKLAEDILKAENEYGTISREKDCVFKIIKCKDYNFYADIELSLDNLPIPWKYLQDKNYEYIESTNEYKNRMHNLLSNVRGWLNPDNMIMEDCDLGELRYVIFEYDNGEYKMIIVSKDRSLFRPSSVGIYTEQMYIINGFVELFDTLWQKIIEEKRKGRCQSNLGT